MTETKADSRTYAMHVEKDDINLDMDVKVSVKENELTICGFSAGGHLCGSVCVHYEDVKDENPKLFRYFQQTGCGDLELSGDHFRRKGASRLVLNRCSGKTRRKTIVLYVAGKTCDAGYAALLLVADGDRRDRSGGKQVI